ncbi:unnamed protein product [Rangifer tarandus platyrhynchus]|uniref:Uncharacterized protein n=1 Tax=Rangifer tarandus platyrhynchus TaxID=3082113 RepID=A0AC60A6D9_RANTA
MFQDRSLIAPAVFLRLQIVGRIFHKAREHLINRELLSCRGGLALFTRTAWPSRYCPGLVHVPRALGGGSPEAYSSFSQFQAPGGANSCPLRWTLRRAGVRAGRAVPSGTLVQDFSSLCKPHADKTSVLAAVGREQGTWLPGTPTQATMALPARDEAGRVRSVLPARRQF